MHVGESEERKGGTILLIFLGEREVDLRGERGELATCFIITLRQEDPEDLARAVVSGSSSSSSADRLRDPEGRAAGLRSSMSMTTLRSFLDFPLRASWNTDLPWEEEK